MCDFACGLSRTIGGKVIPSERKDHIILERWHPLGVIGVITAFNFPHAVFGWNVCLGLVCGNSIVWKGSEMTCLVTIATSLLLHKVLERNNAPNVFVGLVGPGKTVGNEILVDKRINLVSFTGSTRVGRIVS